MKKTMMMMMATAAFGLGGSRTAEAGSSGADAAVRAYVEAGDQRDVSACAAITHPDFRVVFTKGDNGDIALMSKADYLGLLKAEKIGGVPRLVRMEWTKSAGHIAYVKAVLETKGARFDALYTVVKSKGRWLVLQDAVRFDTAS